MQNFLAIIEGYTSKSGNCPGYDIETANEAGITIHQCARKCNARSECAGFVFDVNAECFLKSKTCIEKDQSSPKAVVYEKIKGICSKYLDVFKLICLSYPANILFLDICKRTLFCNE